MIVTKFGDDVPSVFRNVGKIYRPMQPKRVKSLSDYFADHDGNIHNIEYVYVVMPNRTVGFLTSIIGTLYGLLDRKVVQYRYILGENNHQNYLDAIEIIVE